MEDIVVRMPPKKKYNRRLEIKGVRKAKPRIIEPEVLATLLRGLSDAAQGRVSKVNLEEL